MDENKNELIFLQKQCGILDITNMVETGEIEEKKPTIQNNLLFDIEHRESNFSNEELTGYYTCSFIFSDTRHIEQQCIINLKRNYFGNEYTCKIWLNGTDYISLTLKNERITFYFNTTWKTLSLSKILVHK